MPLFVTLHRTLTHTHTIQILFLNKVDLFKEKVLNSDRHLRLFFPQYTGECVLGLGSVSEEGPLQATRLPQHDLLAIPLLARVHSSKMFCSEIGCTAISCSTSFT